MDCHGSGGSELAGNRGGVKEAGESSAFSVFSVGLTLESSQFSPKKLTKILPHVIYSVFCIFKITTLKKKENPDTSPSHHI